MDINLQSKVLLHDLNIREDKKHFIVENKLTGEFFEMPKVGIDAIERMQEGQTLSEIESALKLKYPLEAVELLPFTTQLIDYGLVQAIDDEEVAQQKMNHSPSGLQWIPVGLGKFFFNRISSKIYIAFFLTNILLLIFNPSLLPSYKDVFLFDSMVFNVLTYMFISLILIIIHEFGHIFSIRAKDLPAKLSIGHRLFLVVFETDLTLAWTLPPKERNQLYFAGMAFEQTILLIVFSTILLFDGGNGLLLGIMGIIVFDITIKFIYQCCFYMKTDLYFVVENITGCYNLMESGKQFLSQWFPVWKNKASSTEMFQSEAKIVRYYGVFYLCGVIFMFGLALFYFLPQVSYAISRSIYHVTHYSAVNLLFWDGIVFFAQIILVASLLLYSWMKEKTTQ